MILTSVFKGSQALRLKTGESRSGRFRLIRYFSLTSLCMLVLVALALTYFLAQQGSFFIQSAKEDSKFFKQVQEGLVQQQDDTARRDLLSIHEAGNVNLAHLFEKLAYLHCIHLQAVCP